MSIHPGMPLLFDIVPSDLASPAYVDLQRELHARPKGYGGKGDKWAPAVVDLVAEYGATSVLDYGAGRGMLAVALRQDLKGFVRISEYDPAVQSKSAMPSFADLVVCSDVLEHVEPEKLETVLAFLKILARKAVFVVIATRASNKTMADGRNAHLILEQDEWWKARLEAAGFTVHTGPKSPSLKPSREFVAVLTP